MPTLPPPPPHPPSRPAGTPPIDPLLQRRLDALDRNRPSAKQGGGPATAPRPGRKVKPARASKIASVAVSAATTLALAGLFARQDSGTTDSVVLTSGTDPLTTAATTGGTAAAEATTTVSGATATATVETATAATTAPAATTATTATTATAAAGTIADGTYLGVADQNRWGVVQVQVVYSAGRISDVQILAYPDGDRKSISINQRALPTLISAAISSNSANVDNVSGATYTSNSYITSLQSAIDAAKQASGVTG